MSGTLGSSRHGFGIRRSCRRFRARAAAFLDDALPPLSTIESELHLGWCGGCQEHLDRINPPLPLLALRPDRNVQMPLWR